MEVKCPECGTSVSNEAAMCYACGSQLSKNQFNLTEGLLEIMKKAEKAMDSENWNDAIVHFSTILSYRPEIADIWIYKAYAQSSMRDLEASWQSYSKAIEIEPNNEDNWETRFEMALEEPGDYFQKHIDEYFSQFGRNPDTLIKLAKRIILYPTDHVKTAIDFCNEILLKDAKNRKAKKILKKAKKMMK